MERWPDAHWCKLLARQSLQTSSRSGQNCKIMLKSHDFEAPHQTGHLGLRIGPYYIMKWATWMHLCSKLLYALFLHSCVLTITIHQRCANLARGHYTVLRWRKCDVVVAPIFVIGLTRSYTLWHEGHQICSSHGTIWTKLTTNVILHIAINWW